MSEIEYTIEQLLERAQDQANGIMLITIIYLKQKGLPIEDWAKFVGEQFAPGWNEMKGKGALDFARVDAFNMISFGGKLVSLEGDDHHATLVMDYPIADMAKQFGVSLEDFALFWDGLEAIVSFLGMKYACQRVGERWTYEFSY